MPYNKEYYEAVEKHKRIAKAAAEKKKKQEEKDAAFVMQAPFIVPRKAVP